MSRATWPISILLLTLWTTLPPCLAGPRGPIADANPPLPQANSQISIQISEAGRDDYRAKLLEIGPDSVMVGTDAGTPTNRPVEISSLRSIVFITGQVNADPQEPPPLTVTLLDGTSIRSNSVSNDGKTLSVAVAGSLVEIPTSAALSVQLRELTEKQRPTWDSTTLSVVTSDVLLLVQASGAMTKIEGVVLGIADEVVKFEFSGQVIDVPFSKLAGIRFFTPESEAMPKLQAVVQDHLGNQWQAKQIRLSATSSATSPRLMSLVLRCGAAIDLRLDTLREIDFSVGNVRYVADLEPLQTLAKPLFEFATELPGEAELFGARRHIEPTAPGQSSGPSVQFLGAGEASYRLPSGYSRLVGRAVLRPQGEKFTPCSVAVYFGSNLVWQQSLDEPDNAAAFDVEIPADARLRLVVSTKVDFPTGDVVVWQEPRLLK